MTPTTTSRAISASVPDRVEEYRNYINGEWAIGSNDEWLDNVNPANTDNRTTTGNLINAPFGGLKRSSTSTFRESGRTGLEFYTQVKTIYRAI